MFSQIKRITLCNVKKMSKRFMVTTTSDEILLESIKDVGVITLNRPKALNALNLSMVRQLLPVLKEWEREKALVIIRGAGEKAFCAGGDVIAVVESGKAGDDLGAQFFRTEYTINCLIGNYQKPYVALIDGITMGGGVGLSVHGKYRVATDRTLFAMPETAIGLFPDVGGSYFLPRLQGKLGLYLGLTGHRLKGSDVYKAGIATHYCDSGSMNDLQLDLTECRSSEDVDKCLDKYQINDGIPFELEPVLERINKCFTAPTVEDIIRKLEDDNSEWANNTLKAIKKMSPTSLKLTFAQLQRGSEMKSLAECLQMEYTIAVHSLQNPDFHEGVRARLIDKDNKPVWTPHQLEVITEDHIERFFRRLSLDEELKLVDSSK
ncbi:3-hydroxyisobutyryl-CoA hydrolase, mitochondrial-like [Ctenocephalides felis]|uniref:3-hydroxyisobutyryl-CoA hydrolase, mitochondrial-like n=1 Tax=Ctenocephalides felis TaxID=7515 RepID=UPI000E6E3A9B|nr:3-hydroxyisobutyryl-CoA hydrolase, mitochondrial-like [Ctenocephalides felis]